MIRVLGIDPGTHRLGWGVIEGTAGKQKVVACGILESRPGTKAPEYLVSIHQQLKEIISAYRPEIVGIETLLFQKNVSTAITVAQARGIVLLSAAEAGLETVEMAPNTIKSAVGGSGSAAKKDIERMVGLLLSVDTGKLIDDTTDALATAIAAMVTYRGSYN